MFDVASGIVISSRGLGHDLTQLFVTNSNRGTMSAMATLEPQSGDTMLGTSAWSGGTPPLALVRTRLTGEVLWATVPLPLTKPIRIN
jgi:hypothetical protein